MEEKSLIELMACREAINNAYEASKDKYVRLQKLQNMTRLVTVQIALLTNGQYPELKKMIQEDSEQDKKVDELGKLIDELKTSINYFDSEIALLMEK